MLIIDDLDYPLVLNYPLHWIIIVNSEACSILEDALTIINITANLEVLKIC